MPAPEFLMHISSTAGICVDQLFFCFGATSEFTANDSLPDFLERKLESFRIWAMA